MLVFNELLKNKDAMVRYINDYIYRERYYRFPVFFRFAFSDTNTFMLALVV